MSVKAKYLPPATFCSFFAIVLGRIKKTYIITPMYFFSKIYKNVDFLFFLFNFNIFTLM